MVRAHMSGAIDFSQSDRYSRSWLLKEALVVDQLEVAALTRITELRQILHAAAIGGEAGSDTYKHHFGVAIEALHTAEELWAPWIEWKHGKKDSKELIKEWEAAYDIKVGSPEWEAMLKKFKLADKESQNA